jgi:hypothetical protein
MSTYKEQPVYAELAFNWLELTKYDFRGLTAKTVSTTLDWNFRGGSFADIPTKHDVVHSGDAYPDGPLSTMVTSYGNLTDPLATVVARRLQLTRPSLRTVRTRAASLWATRRLNDTLTRGKLVQTGLHAVYIVMNVLLWAYRSGDEMASWALREDYINECMIGSAADSHMNVPSVTRLTDTCNQVLENLEASKLWHIRNQVEELRAAIGGADVRRKARAAGAELLFSKDFDNASLDVMDCTRSMTVHRLHFFVMSDCAFTVADGTPCVLSKSDVLRLRQLAYSIVSGLEATICQAVMAPGKERSLAVQIGEAYLGQAMRITSDGARAVAQREVSVCKAYRRAFAAYLGELAGPCNEAETELLWKEARETTHATHCDLSGWREALNGYTLGTSFNLAKIFKVCPAPDACPGATLLDRYEQVGNHNTISQAAQTEFREEIRAQILRAYIRCSGRDLRLRRANRAPSWLGSLRAGRYDEVPSAEIHEYLDWEGTAVMPDRHPLDSTCWKDSGLGWDTYEQAIDTSRPKWGGNMVLRMIFDTDCPMPGVLHMPREHYHKVDTKPEGHKDPARGIYSGNLWDRLDQSWMEVAVANVMRAHPSFMIGSSLAERDARVNAITLPSVNAALVDYYYSFDIKGWSPLMPPEVQAISHDIWAELYNSDLFRSAHRINEHSTVYMAKQGFWGWFVNPGVNFEGYNGKEMTVILITLMSLAVKAWRVALVENEICSAANASRLAAMLFAYIDDGLGRVTVPREESRRYLDCLKVTTAETFTRFGFTLEFFKCYPSDRFAIFLNEIYYAGRHIAHGTRAAMTLCAENTERHTTLLERLESVATGCRGAVSAGLDAHAASYMMFSFAWSHIREWISRPDPVVSASWTLAPTSWGGIGMPTMLQLATSGGGTALEEGVSTLQSWAKISKTVKRAYLSCARSKMADRTMVSILTSPMSGSLVTGVMTKSRVPGEVRLALTKLADEGELSPLATEVLSYATESQLEEYGVSVIGETKIVQEQLVRDLYSAHPHQVFSNFAARLEKSSTLTNMIGYKAMEHLIKENKRDVRSSYQVWVHRCI